MKNEAKRIYEVDQDFDRYSDHHGRFRDGGFISVELADAGDLRLADDHLLASRGIARAVLDPVSRAPRLDGRRHALAPPHARTLGAHDARRAGEVPRRDDGEVQRKTYVRRGHQGVRYDTRSEAS